MSRWDRRDDDGGHYQQQGQRYEHSNRRALPNRSRSRSRSWSPADDRRGRSGGGGGGGGRGGGPRSSGSPSAQEHKYASHHANSRHHQQQQQQYEEEQRRRQEALESRGRGSSNGSGTGPGGTSGGKRSAPSAPKVGGARVGSGPPKPPVCGIQMKLAAPASKEPPKLMRPIANAFRQADDSDESEPEEMPAECRMRMRNIGRETPTSSGPNSFGKTKHGFCDSKKMFEKKLGSSLSGGSR
ncbi:PEST proteolytic signal-containing nuclear protein-like isoform X2 [Anopheles albimanus]|uniref:PEST proteolytic signal-containing nuclear protein-like isoform X2 n=1 Tax=Anopheles albimanus TaxID=7167 RepID=UPI00163E79DA|nr:PEST proteolytic signal-containing nuclear protein-like isoform X2 [Anopheles albimanus]